MVNIDKKNLVSSVFEIYSALSCFKRAGEGIFATHPRQFDQRIRLHHENSLLPCIDLPGSCLTSQYFRSHKLVHTIGPSTATFHR